MQAVRKSKPRPNRAKLRRGNGETAAELANGPAPGAATEPSGPAAAAAAATATPAPLVEETLAAAAPAAAADAVAAEQAAPAEPVRVGRLVPARRPRTGTRGGGAGKRKAMSEVRPSTSGKADLRFVSKQSRRHSIRRRHRSAVKGSFDGHRLPNAWAWLPAINNSHCVGQDWEGDSDDGDLGAEGSAETVSEQDEQHEQREQEAQPLQQRRRRLRRQRRHADRPDDGEEVLTSSRDQEVSGLGVAKLEHMSAEGAAAAEAMGDAAGEPLNGSDGAHDVISVFLPPPMLPIIASAHDCQRAPIALSACSILINHGLCIHEFQLCASYPLLDGRTMQRH